MLKKQTTIIMEFLKFNVKTGEQQKTSSNLPAYTKVFADTLVKHAEKDSKISWNYSCNARRNRARYFW